LREPFPARRSRLPSSTRDTRLIAFSLAAFAAVALGLALGIPLAAVSSRVLSTLLAGVATTDPLTCGSVVGVLGITAAVAAFVPARRAAAMYPTIALNEGA